MRRDPVPAAIALLALLLLAGALVLPDWLRFLLLLAFAKGLAVLGVVTLMRGGLVSFGQGLYFGLGGYAAGMTGHFTGFSDVFGLLLLGIAVSVAVALVLGLVMARYREIFFAMLSLAFSMVFYGVLVRSEALGSTDGFNLPQPTFLGHAPEAATGRVLLYLLTVLVVAVAAFLVHRWYRSLWGHLAEAARENEVRVEYLGASVFRVHYADYLLAAATAGAGGVLTAVAVGHVDPTLTYWTTSGEFVFVALVGGTGSVFAPFAGAVLLELVRTFAFAWLPYSWQMILGAVMLLVILFLPGGLWSLVAGREART